MKIAFLITAQNEVDGQPVIANNIADVAAYITKDSELQKRVQLRMEREPFTSHTFKPMKTVYTVSPYRVVGG